MEAMMKRLLVSVITVGLVWFYGTGFASADKMSELVAVAAQMADARANLDAPTICSNLHDDVTALGPNTMFPTTGKKALCGSTTAGFAALESLRVQLFNTNHQVVDNTGYVTGHSRVILRPKGGRPIIRQNYYSTTYVYTEDGWKQLGFHLHPLD
jgi:ketosteroid isomerase-like protein